MAEILFGRQFVGKRANYRLCFLAGGCSSVVEHWLHNGMKDSPEEIAGMIDVINKSVAERLAEL